jgi:molybdopterin molybdotransferase
MPAAPPIPVAEAQRRIVERIEPLDAERVPITRARGRVLAAAVVSKLDLPPWDNSAMDGYALRADDVHPGSSLPVVLDLPAGARSGQLLPPDGVARIMTGAPMPIGADAVIPVEASIGPAGSGAFAEPGEEVRFDVRPEAGANVRRRGEDVSQGSVVLERGFVCHGPEIAMAASAGHASVDVIRQPEVAIVSTGDELVEVEEAGVEDRIVNGNAYGLASKIEQAGGVARMLPIVPDELAATNEAIADALTSDAVVTIGGVSVGGRDYVRDALVTNGVEIVFWRVALRPGGPFAFGIAGRRSVFALPGNPVSALVTFDLFVRPALRKMSGHERCFPRHLRARLAEPISTQSDKAYYLRCRLEPNGSEEWSASITGPQGSGVLSSLVAADGMLIVPQGVDDLPAGAMVDFVPIGDRITWQEAVA